VSENGVEGLRLNDCAGCVTITPMRVLELALRTRRA
jgi:hypothetical protein